jgi:L-fuculose-phosphate aldolase
MLAKDLIGATEGNLSCRLDDGLILCTPSGVSKGMLKPENLLVVDLHGKVVRVSRGRMGFRESEARVENDAKPSSEIKLHLGLYRDMPGIEAVIHAHPIHATGYAYAGKTIPTAHSPEAMAVLGEVALVPFAEPGTYEVPDGIRPFAQAGHIAFLLMYHGAVTVGLDLREAFYRMETLERIARISLVAKSLNSV